ncbi:sacsin N-terminal ATP-binding-like domain-containing protein [Arthrobacter sp. KNU-44]|uniref:sacsin N-terminal ATP-binding-like domain-containing protein n=1 Tax=Arthrobacter sp. KNU-44 TaxID=3450744 RepID=UPI003F422AEF
MRRNVWGWPADVELDTGIQGRAKFLLTDTALIVADNGSGFGEEQVKAICSLGRSSKGPGTSIGHKGLGFKSVGEITDRPQGISRQASFQLPRSPKSTCPVSSKVMQLAPRLVKPLGTSAQASGFTPGRTNPGDALAATPYGMGMLIAAAIDKGARHVMVAAGGSATADGGLGAVRVVCGGLTRVACRHDRVK